MSDGVDIDRVHHARRIAAYSRHPNDDRIAIVIDWLTRSPCTIKQLMAVTGYARCTVEKTLSHLRKDRHECIRSLRYERSGPQRKVAPKPAPAIAAALQAKAEQTDAARIVEQALASRTDLERAWG